MPTIYTMRLGVNLSDLSALCEPKPSGPGGHVAAKVRIVIPVHNAPDYLRRCLASLQEHTPPGLAKIVLVDDASDDDTRSYLDSLEDELTVLRNDQNLGFSATCNCGAAAGDEPFILFLNSDTEVTPGWLPGLIAALEADSQAGAVAPKLLYPDGAVQSAGVFTLEDHVARATVSAMSNHVGLPGDHPAANKPEAVEAATAAALLIRREAFEAVGGFDEGYYNGFEDVELCLSLRERGWKTLYHPEVTLFHHESRSGARRWLKVRHNVARLHERWGGRYTPQALLTPYGEIVPHPARQGKFSPKLEPCDVALLVKNDLPLLPESLDRLISTLGPADSLTVIDFGSADGTELLLDLYEGRDPRLTINRTTAAEGAALDEWLAVCRSTDLAILRPQARCTPGWLSRLQCHLRHGDVGAVCPTTEGDTPGNIDDEAIEVARKHRGTVQRTRTLDRLCLLTKRDVLDRIGGFEPSLPLDGAALAEAIERAGYECFTAHDVWMPARQSEQELPRAA